MRADEFISATTLSKKTSATLEALEKGDKDRLIVLKNNAPKAVLLSMEAYQALEDELEDLRLAAVAKARLETFDNDKALSHEEMMDKFSK